MTKPLRHTKSEIEHAARMACEHGLTTRLEADGAITFIPADHSPKTISVDHGVKLTAVSSIEEWKRSWDNEGEAYGRS